MNDIRRVTNYDNERRTVMLHNYVAKIQDALDDEDQQRAMDNMERAAGLLVEWLERQWCEMNAADVNDPVVLAYTY